MEKREKKWKKRDRVLAAFLSLSFFALLPLQAVAAPAPDTLDEAEETGTDEGSSSILSGVTKRISEIIIDSRETAESNARAREEARIKEEAAAEYSGKAEEKKDEGRDRKLGIMTAPDPVYIRAEATEASDYTGKLSPNGAAFVEGEEKDYYQVRSGDVTGFIQKAYLTVGNEALIRAASREVATVNTTTLYVRTRPSSDSPVLDMVPGNEDLTIADDSMAQTGFIRVEVENGDGYAATQYVTVSRSFTYAESKDAEAERLKNEEAEREAAAAAALRTRSHRARVATAFGRTYAPAGSGNGAEVIAFAEQFLGNPYVYGGTSLTNGTDCSGFVQSIYASFGISLPRTSREQRTAGYGVSVDEMQVGDIICFSGHVGLYAGDGKMINAANPRDGIKYSRFNPKRVLAVRRIF